MLFPSLSPSAPPSVLFARSHHPLLVSLTRRGCRGPCRHSSLSLACMTGAFPRTPVCAPISSSASRHIRRSARLSTPLSDPRLSSIETCRLLSVLPPAVRDAVYMCRATTAYCEQRAFSCHPPPGHIRGMAQRGEGNGPTRWSLFFVCLPPQLLCRLPILDFSFDRSDNGAPTGLLLNPS